MRGTVRIVASLHVNNQREIRTFAFSFVDVLAALTLFFCIACFMVPSMGTR